MFSQASQQLVIDKPARLGSERNAKLWVQMMPQGWFKRNYAPVQSGPTFFFPLPYVHAKCSRPELRFEPKLPETVPFC